MSWSHSASAESCRGCWRGLEAGEVQFGWRGWLAVQVLSYGLRWDGGSGLSLFEMLAAYLWEAVIWVLPLSCYCLCHWPCPEGKILPSFCQLFLKGLFCLTNCLPVSTSWECLLSGILKNEIFMGDSPFLPQLIHNQLFVLILPKSLQLQGEFQGWELTLYLF